MGDFPYGRMYRIESPGRGSVPVDHATWWRELTLRQGRPGTRVHWAQTSAPDGTPQLHINLYLAREEGGKPCTARRR
jgi:hypothetical protein